MKKIVLVSFFALLAALLSTQPASGRGRAQYVPDEIIVKFRAGAVDSLGARVSEDVPDRPEREPGFAGSLKKLGKGPQTPLTALGDPDRYRLLKARPLLKNFARRREHLRALLKKDSTLLTGRQKRILRRLKRAGKGVKVPALDRIYKIKVELSPGQSLEEVVEAYSNHPDVEYAELNYIVSASTVPNDPRYPDQWALARIDAPGAWDIHTADPEIIVAVIDTGVDYGHRDISDNMWVNEAEFDGIAGVDDDGNGYVDDIYGYDFLNKDGDPDDDNGHGTHCAGIVAAEGDNGLDVAGVCWDGRIMALKFLDWMGYGSSSDAVEAICYAVENGADVTSNSWSSSYPSKALEEAVEYARSQGVVMVAAAGNTATSLPEYPAYYEPMLSVAATDAKDMRAWFSTYGDWVDIAAPGLDILSLLAGGGTMRLSGTSMACPHVAGLCALMLSVYPKLDIDRLEWILLQSTDPAQPGTCASGRINARKALLGIVGPQGVISLDRDVYSCSGTVGITLLDSDLKGSGTEQVVVETDGGDYETVLLTEAGSAIGIFSGTIPIDSGPPGTADGMLQVAHEQVITATYFDANDGTGNSATVADTAAVDCEAPVISNVGIGLPGRRPRITFQTDEPATGRVLCGLSCGGPYIIKVSAPALTTSHTIKLGGVLPVTEYFFVVEAVDAAGNRTIIDNGGVCYSFTTTSLEDDVYVPAQCPTIQQGIENCWDGRTVWVADGTYSGNGNRDIDFMGAAITVKSEDGPEKCIIDCNGTEAQPHRGFIFRGGEGADSVLAGLTITNGYADMGGAIYCQGSSPTITNCTFTGNYGGGAVWNSDYSSPALSGCAFVSNTGGGVEGPAGAVVNYYSSPTIADCTFVENISYANGGAVLNNHLSNPTIINCVFAGNSARHRGGAIYNFRSSPAVINCVITDNSAQRNGGAGIFCDQSSPEIANCIISGNTTGGGIVCRNASNPVISNSIISNNSSSYGGAVCSSSECVVTIRNCTITDNRAKLKGGAIHNNFSASIISNCILWNNTAPDGNEVVLWDRSMIDVSYSNVQETAEITVNPGCWVIWGSGNIDAQPLFADAGFWDANDTPSDANDDFWVDGDYHLLEGSPCINAGDPDYVPEANETDLDGRARILSGQIDMGAYEFNHVPVADAGPNTTAYAWIDGIAEVVLDAGRSFDNDGDELTYLWSWTIDGNTYDANGLKAAVQLPVGKHVIGLVVSDGSDDSEPDYVTVTVTEPLQCHMGVLPRRINRHSRGRQIMAWLHLPEGITKDQIDPAYSVLLCPGGAEATRQYIFQYHRARTVRASVLAFFNKADLMDAVDDNGPVRLEVVGRLKSGQYFYGRRTVRMVGSRRHRWPWH